MVLIVAKCNVNNDGGRRSRRNTFVLIVAKCNVNKQNQRNNGK